MIDARVQSADFEPGRQLERLEALGACAVLAFVASVETGEEVEAVHVDHYPALARSELSRIAAEAEQRWDLIGVILVHRHGRLAPGDRVAFAAVAASAPDKAVEALAFLVASLRTRAPFWRKELLREGAERWR